MISGCILDTFGTPEKASGRMGDVGIVVRFVVFTYLPNKDANSIGCRAKPMHELQSSVYLCQIECQE